MNGDQNASVEIEKDQKSYNLKSKNKVDINILLNRVRLKNRKEKNENIILMSLIGILVVISGIIISY